MDPVKPPAGGYNDWSPPPPTAIHGPDVYVDRIRRRKNPKGAAWRLCTIAQPRSVHELVFRIWPSSDAPGDLAMIVTDAFADWRDAGKPATHPPQEPS